MCCDGYCGPDDGENCVGCMELDLRVRGLPKGYLVNTAGNIAKIDNNLVYCGCIVSMGKTMSMCTSKSQCFPCRNLSKTMDRYKRLYA
jgi:hypothetical protein